MRRFLLPADFSASDKASPSTASSSAASFAAPDTLRLEGRDYHYLVNVLRYEQGSSFPGVDRSGKSYRLRILSIDPQGLTLEVRPDSDPQDAAARKSQQKDEIFLFQALLKGKKMDTVIRQATEAEVAHIIPLVSEHTVMKIESEQAADKKLKRWEAVIREAVQQSGADGPPELHPPMQLAEISDFWNKMTGKSSVGLFFHQDPLENSSLHGYLSNWPLQVALMIGPEGGFSAAETRIFYNIGFKPVHLQTNILRAETAAIYSIGAVQTILRERKTWEIIPASHTTDING